MSTKPVKKQVWTNLDAFGLLNGLSIWDTNYLNLRYVRLPDETNLELRRKIKNMHRNPVRGVSTQDLVNGLSNELLLEPYNTINKSTFDLSKNPYPSGNIGEQDIWVYHKLPEEDNWNEVTPQVWASGYYLDEHKTEVIQSGFIVWEDFYYKDNDTTNKKTHMYSRILKIMDPNIPDNSQIKVVYHTKSYDINGNSDYFLYTDMSNPSDPEDDRFIYHKHQDVSVSGFFDNNIVAYNLGQLPPELSGVYYDEDGRATDKLVYIKSAIYKNFKHKWKDIRNRESIWDINKNYSKGTIPSFYDTEFDEEIEYFDEDNSFFDGGIESFSTTLYFKDIYINVDNGLEKWNPILYPGKFYVDGYSYYLMENPKIEELTFTEENNLHKCDLPSGIMRYHKVILIDKTYYDTEYNSNPYIFEDYDYSSVHNKEEIYRKRPYLDKIVLSSGQYYIDYDDNNVYMSSGVIYASGVPEELVLIWDDVIVPSGKICNDVDLNPLNDAFVDDLDYFLTLGE